MRGIDLTGNIYGRLRVIGASEKRTQKGEILWTCRCECGRTVDVLGRRLRTGVTKSCGCLKTERIIEAHKTHGGYGSRLYNIWRRMKQRCNNPKDPAFQRYGGRGIKVCQEWDDDFGAFQAWALVNDYQNGLTIDRKDNNGPYSPENCRWATMMDQQNNRRDNQILTYRGESKTAAEWSRETGISQNAICKRLKDGWGIDRTLSTPMRNRKGATNHGKQQKE